MAADVAELSSTPNPAPTDPVVCENAKQAQLSDVVGMVELDAVTWGCGTLDVKRVLVVAGAPKTLLVLESATVAKKIVDFIIVIDL